MRDRVQLRRAIYQIMAELAVLAEVPCDFTVRIARGENEQIVSITGEAHAYGTEAFAIAMEVFQRILQLIGQCSYVCPNSTFSIRATQAIAEGRETH